MNTRDSVIDFMQSFGLEGLSNKALYATYNRKQKEWIEARKEDKEINSIMLYDVMPEDTIKQLAQQIAKHIKCDQL